MRVAALQYRCERDRKAPYAMLLPKRRGEDGCGRECETWLICVGCLRSKAGSKERYLGTLPRAGTRCCGSLHLKLVSLSC